MNKDKDILSGDWLEAETSFSEEGEIRSALNRMAVEAPDTEMAWKALSSKLDLKEEKPTPAHRVSIWLVAKAMISVAAALLVVFLLVKNSGNSSMPDVNAPTPLTHHSIALSRTDSASKDSPIYNKVVVKTGTPATSENLDLLTAETGRGGCRQLVLRDGTKVWLNAESSLRYPKHFSKDERRVYLSGEAYFEVKHNRKRPFVVETASLVATDLGTAFDVKAYQGKSTQLILVSGKVAVQRRGEDSAPVVMKPDEMATLEGGTIRISGVDTYPLIQWKNGLFYFHHASLLEVMKEIGRWYHVNVVFENKHHLNMQVHFVAERSETIETIVKQLNEIEGVNVEVLKNELTVK